MTLALLRAEVAADTPDYGWKMDESTGTRAAAYGGIGLTPTSMSTETDYDGTGLAASFNGSTGKMVAGSNVPVNQQCTIEFLFKPDATQSATLGTIFGFATGDYAAILNKKDVNKLQMYVSSGSQFLSSATIPAGWVHVVIAFDASGNGTFYLNGVSAGTLSGWLGRAGMNNFGEDGFSDTYKGGLSDFYVYNDQTFSGGDVARHYDALVSGGAAPPAAPSDLASTGVTASTVALQWTDNAGDEIGFTLQITTAADTGFASPVQEIDIPTADTETANPSGLEPETDYIARVRAYNGSGNSDWSNTVSFTTAAIAALAAPSVNIQSVSPGSVTVNWSAATGGTGAYTYNAYRGGVLVASGVSSPYTFTGLLPGTAYPDLAIEVDDGESSDTASTSAVTTCAAPVLSGSRGNTVANLAYTSPTGVVSFTIYQDGVQIAGGVTTTTYQVTGLTNGVPVVFTVKAVGSNGQASTASNAVTITPRAPMAVSGSITPNLFQLEIY